MTLAAALIPSARGSRLALAMAAGAVTVAGFAPVGIYPLPAITLALYALLWRSAASAKDAALAGGAFGPGFFEGYSEPFNLEKAKKWAQETRCGVLLLRPYWNAR